jgi:hypothetical protein
VAAACCFCARRAVLPALHLTEAKIASSLS